MTETAAAVAAPPAEAQGLAGRVFGVLTAPKATYAGIVAHPRALGVLVLGILLIAGATVAFFSTEVGRQAVLDQQEQGLRAAEALGFKIPDQALQQMEERVALPSMPYITAASRVVLVLLFVVVIAGLIMVVFNAILGGDASFKQVFALVAHSGMVTVTQTLFSLPLDYVRESLSSPTALSIFVPFLEETSFGARLLGSIDLFRIWWILNLAIGLGVLYKRRTQPIATGLLVTYVAIAFLIAAVRAAFS